MRAHHERCNMPQALCELDVSPTVSNDGSEETGTEAGARLIRSMLRMIKCYIRL